MKKPPSRYFDKYLALACLFRKYMRAQVEPGSHSTPLPPNMIVNGLLAIEAAGISSTCCSSGAAGGGNLGRMLAARLCGQTSTAGRRRRLRGGWVDRGTNRGRLCRDPNDGGQQAQRDLGIDRRQPVITPPTQKKQ